jgi:pilus assembly protein Flp/PilA
LLQPQPLTEKGETKMLTLILKLRALALVDNGQDLVEYALVIALIACGAIASVGALSTQINMAFNVISSDLATAL